MLPSVYVGVGISIAGNIIISLALNVQKVAHKRLSESKGDRQNDDNKTSVPRRADQRIVHLNDSGIQQAQYIPRVEVEPPTPLVESGFFTNFSNDPSGKKHTILVPASRVASYSSNTYHGDDNDDDQESSTKQSTYLKSKLWWLGLSLMAIGEAANFISYGLAAASVVAPLGTVALIANCFISPIMLHEPFGYRDAAGVILAVLGAVTVVLSAKQQDREFDPNDLLVAIKQTTFIGYSIGVIVVLTALLILTHTKRYGNRWVVVDVLICSLFGGFTVLSTKALSSLLSTIFLQALAYPITWCLIAVLVGTSLGQIRYLNKALQSFESREVIPTQFVFFSISAIVGSAVLYQEFRDLTASRFANFLFGIATTFVGVFLLTWKKNEQDDEDQESQHGSSAIVPIGPGLRRLDSLAEEEPLLESSTQPIPTYTNTTATQRQRLRKRASTTSLHRHGLVGGGYLLIASSPPSGLPIARSFEGGTRSSSRSSAVRRPSQFPIERSGV